MDKTKNKNFFIRNYISKFKTYVFLGPFFKALEAATEILIPFLMAIVIDNYIPTNNQKMIWILFGVIVGLNIIGIIAGVVGQKFSSIATEIIGKEMRKDIFSHVNTFSHAELDKFSTPSILNRTVGDVYNIQNGIGMFLRSGLRAPFIMVGSIIMALTIDLKMSILFVVVMPLLLLVVFYIMKKITPYLVKIKQKTDRTSLITRENLSGNRVVRAFNKQDYEVNRFKNANNELLDVSIGETKISSSLLPIIYMIINIGVILLVYFGGLEINIGGLTQGKLIAFINYFNQVALGLVVIARLITMFTRVRVSSYRIDELMSVTNSIVDPKKPVKFDINKAFGKVEFNDVYFSYNGIKNVISELNFTAKPGEVIGIIGGTGSGKSSVVNLIPRFYDATKGSVKIDDINVKNYKLSDLRSMISIVPQNPVLFEGTIRSNLMWGNPEASEDDLIKALKISQSYDFVKENENFLDAKVNRGGNNFSGGQKQRLTIARALVKNPKILILDDSSSALDFATDAKLRNALFNKTNTTIFIVSQRTNSIKKADKIIVLDGGQVLDIGTHDELLSRCSLYKEIHLSQQQGGEKYV